MESPFSIWKIFDPFCVPTKVQPQAQSRNPSSLSMIKYDPNAAKDDTLCTKLLKLGSCQNLCPVAKIEARSTPADYSSGSGRKQKDATADEHATAQMGKHSRKRSLSRENEIERTSRVNRTHNSTDYQKNHGSRPRNKAEAILWEKEQLRCVYRTSSGDGLDQGVLNEMASSGASYSKAVAIARAREMYCGSEQRMEESRALQARVYADIRGDAGTNRIIVRHNQVESTRLYPYNYHKTEDFRAGNLDSLALQRFDPSGARC